MPLIFDNFFRGSKQNSENTSRTTNTITVRSRKIIFFKSEVIPIAIAQLKRKE